MSDPGSEPDGLGPESVAPDERTLHHWSAPHGKGLLTNRRCLVLSHPLPIHRELRWSKPLEQIDSMEVRQEEDTATTTVAGIGGSTLSAGAPIPGDSIPGSFLLMVDDTPVFRGYPRECQVLQARIDEARTVRRRELGLGPSLR